jgi:type IV secretory pathway TrbL component
MCSEGDAATRLRNAQKFVDVAELVAGEGDDVEYSSQAAALAVLAGIAASDAACCKALGRRSRGQDHRAAATLVEDVTPGGKQAAKALNRLLSLKDEAHYGLFDVSGQDLKSALRQASDLVEFAEEVLRR